MTSTSTPPTSRTRANEANLFVVSGSALSPLTRSFDLPADFAALVADNLDGLVDEAFITIAQWDLTEHPDRPMMLAFDDEGSLAALMIAGEPERTAAVASWLATLTLRDVLKMHVHVEELMDALLALNPDELHLSLGPRRRVIEIGVGDPQFSAPAMPDDAPDIGYSMIELEIYADPSNATAVLMTRVTSDETEATKEQSMTSSLAPPPVAAVGTLGAFDSEPAVETDTASEGLATTDVDTDTGQSDTDTDTGQSDIEASTETGQSDSTANTAQDAAIEPGAVAFRPGTTMRTIDLLSYLARDEATAEVLDDGTIVFDEHVLLIEPLSESHVLESRDHFKRLVGTESLDQFHEWYDGTVPQVTFHLLARHVLNPEETTYVGRLKPTAWEHRGEGQSLLFRLVPRLPSALWILASKGELPGLPVPEEPPEPWPVKPAKEIDLRESALQRVGRRGYRRR